MSATACPTGCGRTRRRSHLMCRTCWGEVPRELQADVLRTWRAWWNDLGNTEKLHAYEAAAEAATAAVR